VSGGFAPPGAGLETTMLAVPAVAISGKGTEVKLRGADVGGGEVRFRSR